MEAKIDELCINENVIKLIKQLVLSDTIDTCYKDYCLGYIDGVIALADNLKCLLD